MLVGNGFDIHRHSNDKKLVLGGISFEGIGFEAHSDGDIVLHSICDALLGATGKKDLGFYFPSNSSTPENISSIEMLKKIYSIVHQIHNLFYSLQEQYKDGDSSLFVSLQKTDLSFPSKNPKKIEKPLGHSIPNPISLNRQENLNGHKYA